MDALALEDYVLNKFYVQCWVYVPLVQIDASRCGSRRFLFRLSYSWTKFG